MSCKRYQHLLHLNRSGEISEREAEDLRQHLGQCESCSLEFQRIQRADEFVDRLTSLRPPQANAEKLTANILRRVRAEAFPHQPQTLTDRIAETFLQPVVRYAAVGIVLIITTTFAIQLLTTVNDIYALEQRMATSKTNPSGSTPTYTAESKTLRGVTEAGAAKGLTGNVSFSLTDGHIEVPERNVAPLLSAYGAKNLTTILGSTGLHIDKKTIENIVNEIKATARRSFSVGSEGA